MVDNVITLPASGRVRIPPEKVIEGLQEENFEQILVIGRLADDPNEILLASSTGETGELLLLIEDFKHRLMRGDYG